MNTVTKTHRIREGLERRGEGPHEKKRSAKQGRGDLLSHPQGDNIKWWLKWARAKVSFCVTQPKRLPLSKRSDPEAAWNEVQDGCESVRAKRMELTSFRRALEKKLQVPTGNGWSGRENQLSNPQDAKMRTSASLWIQAERKPCLKKKGQEKEGGAARSGKRLENDRRESFQTRRSWIWPKRRASRYSYGSRKNRMGDLPVVTRVVWAQAVKTVKRSMANDPDWHRGFHPKKVPTRKDKSPTVGLFAVGIEIPMRKAKKNETQKRRRHTLKITIQLAICKNIPLKSNDWTNPKNNWNCNDNNQKKWREKTGKRSKKTVLILKHWYLTKDQRRKYL